DIGNNNIIQNNNTIGDNTIIGNNNDIANNTNIGQNNTIQNNNTIGDNTDIGNNNTIENNNIIGNNTDIGNNNIIQNNNTIGDNTIIGNNNDIANNTNIGQNNTIQNNNTIGNNVQIGQNNTIGNNTNIGNNSTIGNNNQILTNTTIGNNSNIGDENILANNTNIGQNVTLGDGNIISNSTIQNSILINSTINNAIVINSSLTNAIIIGMNVTENVASIACGGLLENVNSSLSSNLTTSSSCLVVRGSNVQVELNNFSLIGGNAETAIEVNGTNITISNGSITNFSTAIKIDAGSGEVVIDGLTLTNSETGLFADPANIRIANSVFANNIFGIKLFNTYSSILSNLRIENNTQTGLLLNASSNNIIRNSTLQNNTLWDFFAVSGSGNNIGTNITSLQNVISFVAKDVALKGIAPSQAPSDPTSLKNISKYINATNNSATSSLWLNISYSDTEISSAGIEESSLALFRHNGSEWNLVSGSAVDTTANIVFANITGFSTFAPFGSPPAAPSAPSAGGPRRVGVPIIPDRTPPNITFITPTPPDGSVTNVSEATISILVSDESAIKSVLLEFDGKSYPMVLREGRWTYTLTHLKEGSHNFRVFAEDVAGNRAASPIRSFVVKLPVPAPVPPEVVPPPVPLPPKEVIIPPLPPRPALPLRTALPVAAHSLVFLLVLALLIKALLIYEFKKTAKRLWDVMIYAGALIAAGIMAYHYALFKETLIPAYILLGLVVLITAITTLIPPKSVSTRLKEVAKSYLRLGYSEKLIKLALEDWMHEHGEYANVNTVIRAAKKELAL
ncbi:MAG: right-handed parallel beta-helix repeat-containing protein, partial [Candidatus Woesearchaeota archaeon]